MLRFEPTGDGHVGVLEEFLVIPMLLPSRLVLRRVVDGEELVFLAAHRGGEDAVAEEVVHQALSAALSSPVLGHDACGWDFEMDVGGNKTEPSTSGSTLPTRKSKRGRANGSYLMYRSLQST